MQAARHRVPKEDLAREQPARGTVRHEARLPGAYLLQPALPAGPAPAAPGRNPEDENAEGAGAPEDEDRHVGDMGNIEANEAGVAEGTLVDSLIKLSGEYTVVGRSVMVHADPDDLGKGGHELGAHLTRQSL